MAYKFIDNTAGISHWAKYKYVYLLVGLILLIAIIIAVWWWMKNKKAKEAMKSMKGGVTPNNIVN
jgi:NADH:ubiquinone oxidoreductase subunit 6 (subunit J)